MLLSLRCLLILKQEYLGWFWGWSQESSPSHRTLLTWRLRVTGRTRRWWLLQMCVSLASTSSCRSCHGTCSSCPPCVPSTSKWWLSLQRSTPAKCACYQRTSWRWVVIELNKFFFVHWSCQFFYFNHEAWWRCCCTHAIVLCCWGNSQVCVLSLMTVFTSEPPGIHWAWPHQLWRWCRDFVFWLPGSPGLPYSQELWPWVACAAGTAAIPKGMNHPLLNGWLCCDNRIIELLVFLLNYFSCILSRRCTATYLCVCCSLSWT